MTTETITIGGGCFWCLEAVYEWVDGVLEVESGYANGHLAQPSYEQVCSGTTGHAEVVRVRFDPSRITLQEILEIFFAIHDPTTLNRQGNDVGTQYRSCIYWHEEGQRAVAERVVTQTQAATRDRVVTEIQPLGLYTRAEDEHQHYFARHPGQGYCAFVVAPKVAKFQRTFATRLRKG